MAMRYRTYGQVYETESMHRHDDVSAPVPETKSMGMCTQTEAVCRQSPAHNVGG